MLSKVFVGFVSARLPVFCRKSFVKAQRGEQPGFTLIEIILVMAVLGIIAGITLVAVNPLEQLAKTSDVKTKQSVNQLGGLLTAFYAQKQAFPVADSNWMDDLIANADLGERPDPPSKACSPAASSDNQFCLQHSGGAAVVYARLASNTEDKKCAISSDVPYFAYFTARGSSCIVCGATNATISPSDVCDAGQ